MWKRVRGEGREERGRGGGKERGGGRGKERGGDGVGDERGEETRSGVSFTFVFVCILFPPFTLPSKSLILRPPLF